MKKVIKINFVILLILLFVDSLGNGISNIILPQVIEKNKLGSSLFGLVIGLQSFIGLFILLPQATFINKKGEMKCIRYGVIANMIVYSFYWVGMQMSICIGKFVEGFADRLLNSSLSKLVYDYTDGTNNRGRYRAIFDMVGTIGGLLGPIIISIVSFIDINLAFPIIICIMIIGLLLSFVFFREDMSENKLIVEEKNENNMIHTLFINHIDKYLKNKKIIFLTIPSLLFSCFDIFGSLLLGLFLLENKYFTSTEYAMCFSAISIITLLIQYPLGFFADKKRNILLFVSLLLAIIGGNTLILANSKIMLSSSVVCIYISALCFTASMSVLFGDMTTKSNRLSESEVYRTIRLIGSGLFSVVLSMIYDINAYVSIIIVCSLLIISIFILMIINIKHVNT